MKKCCGNNYESCENDPLKDIEEARIWVLNSLKEEKALRKIFDKLTEVGYTQDDAIGLINECKILKEKKSIDPKPATNTNTNTNMNKKSFWLNETQFGIHTAWFTKKARHIENEQNFPIFAIDDFLTSQECDVIKAIAEPHLITSTVTAKAYEVGKDSGKDPDNINTDSRISKVAYLSKVEHDPPLPGPQMLFVLNTVNKMCLALGVHPDRTEGLQVQYYPKGGYFKTHQDAWDRSTEHGAGWACPENGGNRIYTFMIYLNEPKKGGGTTFHELTNSKGKKLKIKPKKGMAVTWTNLNHDGTPNPLALHSGDEIKKGSKWITNLWIRESSEDKPKMPHEFKPMKKAPPPEVE